MSQPSGIDREHDAELVAMLLEVSYCRACVWEKMQYGRLG